MQEAERHEPEQDEDTGHGIPQPWDRIVLGLIHWPRCYQMQADEL